MAAHSPTANVLNGRASIILNIDLINSSDLARTPRYGLTYRVHSAVLGEAHAHAGRCLPKVHETAEAPQLLDTELDKCCFKSALNSARRGGDIHGLGAELIKRGVFVPSQMLIATLKYLFASRLEAALKKGAAASAFVLMPLDALVADDGIITALRKSGNSVTADGGLSLSPRPRSGRKRQLHIAPVAGAGT